jgi:hypothetical protein
VPRWSRSSLARLSCPSVLLTAAVFTGACLCGDAGAQQLNDTDSALLAPALNGNPRSPPRFQAGPKKPKKEDGGGLGLGELPSAKFAPASGAGSTGFESPLFLTSHDIYAGGGRVDDRYTASVALSYRASSGSKASTGRNGSGRTCRDRITLPMSGCSACACSAEAASTEQLLKL